MIISIRGTSGSGKSTIARKLMECYPYVFPQFISGRKQPISYYCDHESHEPLAVIGHYESPCGGCDTIHTFEEVFAQVRKAAALGYHVLFEGVLLYCEVPLTIKLAVDYPFKVIALTTPIDECVRCVNLRRSTKSVLATAVDPKNTVTKYNGTITTMKRLTANDVVVEWCDREQAFVNCLKAFNLNPALALLQ